MFIDSYGLIVENNGSGGDSAHYSSMYVIATDNRNPLSLHKLVNGDGYIVRHPGDQLVEWHSNPNNTSRDQTMATVVALAMQGRQDLVRKITAQYSKRLFFAQNIDRDWPNSTKRPYPHKYVDLNGESKFSWFNYRDPLLPHHIHAMLASAGYKWHFLLYPISITTFIIEGLSLRLGDNDDIGTFFSTGYGLGLTKLFKVLIPDWRYRFNRYYLGWRNGQIIHDDLVSKIERL